jgi:hypothetical protein
MPGDVASGITRRNALKKLGAGAAVAWSAPVLLTVGAGAFAASLPSCASLGGTCATSSCSGNLNGACLAGQSCFSSAPPPECGTAGGFCDIGTTCPVSTVPVAGCCSSGTVCCSA